MNVCAGLPGMRVLSVELSCRPERGIAVSCVGETQALFPGIAQRELLSRPNVPQSAPAARVGGA